MTGKEFSAFGKLMSLLVDMEQDLGLANLSDPERRVLSAIAAIAQNENVMVSSKQIKNGAICKELADATYYRALKGLIDRGYISVVDGRKTGLYKLITTS